MTYGDFLTKDQFPLVNKQIISGISFINEFREFIKERSSIEREYGTKLENLAKKFSNKKGLGLGELEKSSSDMISLAGSVRNTNHGNEDLGLDPEYSTLLKGLSVMLGKTEALATDKVIFSEFLMSEIVDPLKMLANKTEESRKKHTNFSRKMTEEKDKIAGELVIAKQKYEESCIEIQAMRSKQEKTLDTKSYDKNQKQYYQDAIDRNNNKNLYLMAIDIANKHSDKHYNEDVPALLNHMQTLNESWMIHIKSLWLHYNQLERTNLEEGLEHLEVSKDGIDSIDYNNESKIFVEGHPSTFTPPNHAKFHSFLEYSEDDKLIDEFSSKVFLNNKLHKVNSKLEETGLDLNGKQKEFDSLYQRHINSLLNPDSEDFDEVREEYFEIWRNLVLLKDQELISKGERDIILERFGNDFVDGIRHDFKPNSFTIPTTCDYCDSTIWGLSRHGATCKDCKYNCHTKCELKVTPNCTMVKGGGKSSRSANFDFSTLTDKTAPFLKNNIKPIRQPIPDTFVTQPNQTSPSLNQPIITSPIVPISSFPTAIALYDYQGVDSADLSVPEGSIIEIIEPDDGSGWVKARLNNIEGLLPATYIQLQDSIPTTTQSFSTLSQAQALYDFPREADTDLALITGDIINNVQYEIAEGWSQGELNGKKGQFPTSYVQPL